MHGWAYSRSRLCGCCRPASGHTTASSNPELGKYKGSVGSCPRVLHVSFSCVLRVLASIRPCRQTGGLGGKVGSACEDAEDAEGGILG